VSPPLAQGPRRLQDIAARALTRALRCSNIVELSTFFGALVTPFGPRLHERCLLYVHHGWEILRRRRSYQELLEASERARALARL